MKSIDGRISKLERRVLVSSEHDASCVTIINGQTCPFIVVERMISEPEEPPMQSDSTKSLAADFFARMTGEEVEHYAKSGKLPAWFNKEP